MPDTYDDDIANLAEWLDLASVVLSELIDGGASMEGRRRELYNGILGSVGELQRRGLTILSGVMSALQNQLPDWKVPWFRSRRG